MSLYNQNTTQASQEEKRLLQEEKRYRKERQQIEDMDLAREKDRRYSLLLGAKNARDYSPEEDEWMGEKCSESKNCLSHSRVNEYMNKYYSQEEKRLLRRENEMREQREELEEKRLLRNKNRMREDMKKKSKTSLSPDAKNARKEEDEWMEKMRKGGKRKRRFSSKRLPRVYSKSKPKSKTKKNTRYPE